jgi:hypothetical protein
MLKITNDADLIASVPSLLGYTPTESVVAVMLEGGVIRYTTRVDLSAIDANAASALGAVRVHTVDAALLVAVTADEERAFEALGVLTEQFPAHGVRVIGAFTVPTITAGAEWFDQITEQRGRIADPKGTELAAVLAFEGSHTAADSRESLLEAVADRLKLAPKANMTPALAASVRLTFAAETVAELLAARGGVVTADLAARVGLLAARAGGDRDALFVLGHGGHEVAGTETMLAVAAQLRDEPRAAVLTLAAVLSYVGVATSTAVTGVILDAARTGFTPVSAGKKLLDLLDHAIGGGMDPEVMRELIEIGAEAAVDLGVEID